MAVLDQLKAVVAPTAPTKPDKRVQARIDRGRKRMRELAPLRNECIEMWRGNQYIYRDSLNVVRTQSTVTTADGSGKPKHRVRGTHNLLVNNVSFEVSAATQMVPSYEVAPSNTDPDTLDAAQLSEKVLLYGYDEWDVRRAVVGTVTYAIVADEGFAWPYFDNTIGTPIGGGVATGEIKIRVFGPNEVYWEPGVSFEDSRWHCVENARPLEEIKALPGYIGGELKADAKTSDVLGKTRKQDQLALVTEYLERPSIANPIGRRIVLAGKRIILPEEPYPCSDENGEAVDEPVLHRITYVEDPDSDRGSGLVRHCLDDMRTYNDCYNKLTEWKNLALMPQLLAPEGSITTRRTDEPGQIIYYKPGFEAPTWQPVPQIPRELFELADQAHNNINNVFSQNLLPPGVSAARSIELLIERDASRRQAFLANLAEFYSRLARHCLYLVQKHYTEKRLVKVRGELGYESIQGFLGADLRGEADVRVSPGSLEPTTRASVEQKVMNLVQIGAITPEQAMAAMDQGTTDSLLIGYELQLKHAQRTIQKALALGRTLSSGATPEDFARAAIPTPRKYDNIPIHRDVLHNFFMTVDYENQPEQVKYVLEQYDAALDQLQVQKQAEEAAQQAAQAAQLGLGNAASPQGGKPMPSLPSAAGQAKAPA